MEQDLKLRPSGAWVANSSVQPGLSHQHWPGMVETWLKEIPSSEFGGFFNYLEALDL